MFTAIMNMLLMLLSKRNLSYLYKGYFFYTLLVIV
jgi:hypothetical protein